MQEKDRLSSRTLLKESVQSSVRLFSKTLLIQADERVAFFNDLQTLLPKKKN